MKHQTSFACYSLFFGLLGAAILPHNGMAAVRVVNQVPRNYADAYNQLNKAQNSAIPAADPYAGVTTTSATKATSQLPVRVANANLAEKLARGEQSGNVTIPRLESCANIYPNGEFAWDTPTAGRGTGGAQTCVAVVEMRGYQMGPGGTDLVLARANVAAGDAVKCNISDFPESGYTNDVANVIFPADTEPTTDDVIRVLNAEQKKGAGYKIAATTIVGALGGNIAAGNEIGEDSLMGTGKKKMKGTLIGALGGAAIGAGSAYSGKVAGDMILSTGVNAAAGGTVGNIMATGKDVLRIEDCELPDKRKTTCLWGMLVSKKPLNLSNPSDTQNKYKAAFYNIETEETLVCDGTPNADGAYTGCTPTDLISITLDAYPDKDLEAAHGEAFNKIVGPEGSANQFHIEKSPTGTKIIQGSPYDGTGIYAKISDAGIPDKQTQALIADFSDKAFGMKKSDWTDWKKKNANSAQSRLYGRNNNGNGFALDGTYSIKDFYPMYKSATDGGIIDFGNKARLKGTLIGAGAGGAIGAFTAYQGAQSDIEERWVAAVREYKDSLQKIYCITGSRFLTYYNDTVLIPNENQ